MATSGNVATPTSRRTPITSPIMPDICRDCCGMPPRRLPVTLGQRIVLPL